MVKYTGLIPEQPGGRMPETEVPQFKASYVVRPTDGEDPQIQISNSSIPHLVPIIWEASVRRVIAKRTTNMWQGDGFIIITVPKGTSPDGMRNIASDLVETAHNRYAQRAAREAANIEAATAQPTSTGRPNGIKRDRRGNKS